MFDTIHIHIYRWYILTKLTKSIFGKCYRNFNFFVSFVRSANLKTTLVNSRQYELLILAVIDIYFYCLI